ncbi:hypothetical protein D9757_013813 [Collybiopsis confluens]|nr:hypothetical protein D9757_013813 [Collybiopsis confluens]
MSIHVDLPGPLHRHSTCSCTVISQQSYSFPLFTTRWVSFFLKNIQIQTSSFSFFSSMASENSQIRIVTCAPSSYPKLIPKLALLLKECVHNNIVMNFIQPFSIEEGEKFWKDLEQGVNENKQFIIVALEGDPNERVEPVMLGCVILYLSQQPNAKHRGEIGKLIVGREHQRKGIGKMLLTVLEEEARKHGRTILFLDTQTGSKAETFYKRVGYIPVGVIPDICLAPDGKELTSCTFFYKRI